MSTDLPDFLGGEPAPEPQAAPTPESSPPALADLTPDAGGPARGPDGKFAPATPQPSAEAAPAAPVDAQGHVVPLATFLDLRDKATAAEKRAQELQTWRDQQEAAARRQPIPDPNVDPEGHRKFVQESTQAAFADLELSSRREISRIRAEFAHGKETVDQAFTWADQQIQTALDQGKPSALNDEIRRHPDPIGFVVEHWKRDQINAKIGDPARVEAFLAWEAAQAAGQPGAPITPAAAAAPPARPAAPRQSLAAAPSAGAHAGAVPRDGAATFDAMFGS